MWRLTELKNKEVINIKEGNRLGYISDVEFDMATGKIRALIVPGPFRFLGIFGRGEDYVIPFTDIQKTGNDIILVAYDSDTVKYARKRSSIFRD